MLFDQNKEKLQPNQSSDEPQEKAKDVIETSSSGSDGFENTPSATFPTRPMAPAKPHTDSAPVKSDAQPTRPLGPASLTSDAQARPGINAAPLKPVEPANAQPNQAAF